jgi:phospholipase/carboxylesterase
VISTIGALRCRVVRELAGTPPLTVVLCHGYGAPGDDLVPLADAVRAHRPNLAAVRFVFPEAPLSLEELGAPFGRAWWQIDFQRITARRLTQDVPPGLSKARHLMMSLLDELARQPGGAISRLLLGGFSQGAMLATDLTLRLEEAPAGLAILSGTLICESEWRQRASIRRGLSVFQSHGRQDPLLPFESALALKDLLLGAGLTVDFLAFEGGHTIPLEAIDRLAALIESKAALAPPGGDH